jgi:hypothetical protein
LEFIVCARESLLTNVTRDPGDTVSVLGDAPLAVMVIVVPPPGDGVGVGVGVGVGDGVGDGVGVGDGLGLGDGDVDGLSLPPQDAIVSVRAMAAAHTQIRDLVVIGRTSS